MRNVMCKTRMLNRSCCCFSAQDGVNAESEFAKHHRKRVAPRRIDDTPENAVHFGSVQTFYRKEFLQVLDAQILLLEDNLKVAFKIMHRARCFLARATLQE